MTVRKQPNAIHEELIRSWGAVPVEVELSEAIRLITSLEVGTQENPLANTAAHSVDRVHPLRDDGRPPLRGAGLLTHRATFESLPEDLRLVVQSAVATAIEVQRKAAADLETERTKSKHSTQRPYRSRRSPQPS